MFEAKLKLFCCLVRISHEKQVSILRSSKQPFHQQSVAVYLYIHCKNYFNQNLIISVAFLLCVGHVKFKECLQFEQSVVEKVSSFVKLVSPFRKPINQHCEVYDLTHLPLESFLVACLW